jgi:hypothetical protein
MKEITRLFIVKNNMYKTMGFNPSIHYVVRTKNDMLFPLTDNKISYFGIKNVKISDENIIGDKNEQYLVPIGHEYDIRKL